MEVVAATFWRTSDQDKFIPSKGPGHPPGRALFCVPVGIDRAVVLGFGMIWTDGVAVMRRGCCVTRSQAKEIVDLGWLDRQGQIVEGIQDP